jgi:hypothetical protein
MEPQDPVDDRGPVLEGVVEPAPEPPPNRLDPMALLQALQGPSDPLSLILSQMAANAPDDQNLALMSQLIQQRRAAEQASDPEEESRREETETRLAELSGMVERLYREAEALRARSAELADAVGACPVCFGADLLCPKCGGRGRPGSRPPRPDAYRVYVLPAVARVKRIMEARRPHEPELTRPPGPTPVNSSDKGNDHARYV